MAVSPEPSSRTVHTSTSGVRLTAVSTTGPRLGDRIFHAVCLAAALVVPALILLLVFFLVADSWPAIQKFGVQFFVSASWSVSKLQFGALPFIYGTLVTSALAMLIA